MQHGDLPEDLTLQRTTDPFDAAAVPQGLLRAHQIATGVWGRLRVLAGTVTFVWEDGDREPHHLAAGDAVVIPPEVRHHVEPGPDARFEVEFHR